MKEKHYKDEHIDEIIKGALEIIKVAENFNMCPVEYETDNYKIFIDLAIYKDGSTYKIAIKQVESEFVDYYKVNVEDYSVKYVK